MTAFALGNLVLNVILAVGLKYLWNMVNLLQFIVFMRNWGCTMPQETEIFLEALKTLALFEFLPTDQIDDTVMGWLGIEKDDSGEQKSWFDDLAVVMIFAIVLLFLFLILLIGFLVKRHSAKCISCLNGLKKKLFFGVLIRYLLLGTLKTQMSLCTGLSIGNLIPETFQQPAKGLSFTVVASTVICLLNLAPLLFGVTLWRNRKNLTHPEVKQKIGAMYELHDAKRDYVGTYSVVFLIRRSIFVMITFALHYYPGL